jgi:hypothetical protein
MEVGMPKKNAAIEGLPMVTDPTRAQSESIETVVTRLRSERVVIPDYQRDADQWDIRKESLFIESILNNLTVPAFFFSETSEGPIEVVDGQQRLNTILKYANNESPISDDEVMIYLTPQSVHYRGKRFSELHTYLQNVFNDYPLTIIYLPRNIELGTKLEIFRRINEGGTPLTAQDIRLSYYSESPSVMLIRLAGIHGDTPAAQRMLEAAKRRGVDNPWESHQEAWTLWCDWWEGKLKARGQTPSEMFLWYLVTLHRNEMENLVSSPDQMKHLPISFRGSTEEALDIYCAQLQWTDEKGGVLVFSTYERGLPKEFDNFAAWIRNILSMGITGLSVDKYKQAALFIGAAVELGISMDKVSNDAWDAISEFIRTPRQAGSKWLEKGYPEQKGRWRGTKGQKTQCDQAIKLVQAIMKKHP